MKFHPTDAMIAAATLVFMHMAKVAVIRPIVEGYQKELLAKHQFKVRDEFSERRGAEVILDPKLSYLMPDEDFAIYDAECKAARDTAGLHVEDKDFCPLLVAENDLIKAKRTLVDVMESVTGIGHDKLMCNFDKYDEYIDLCLKLLSPYVKNPFKEVV